jgi:hypothetical protein
MKMWPSIARKKQRNWKKQMQLAVRETTGNGEPKKPPLRQPLPVPQTAGSSCVQPLLRIRVVLRLFATAYAGPREFYGFEFRTTAPGRSAVRRSDWFTLATTTCPNHEAGQDR